MLIAPHHLFLNGSISQPTARAVSRCGRCINPDQGADTYICLYPPIPRGGFIHLFVSAPGGAGNVFTFVCIHPSLGRIHTFVCIRPGGPGNVFLTPRGGFLHLFVSAPYRQVYAPMLASPLLPLCGTVEVFVWVVGCILVVDNVFFSRFDVPR